jgi:phospholipase/carboxylesterase
MNIELIQQGQQLEQASKAMILLHGRGGAASDIITLAAEFCDESFYIVAPQASNHSWYPHHFMVEEHLNEPWLSASVETIKKIIDDIAQYIPKNQIYLMGFSQGACLALETAARFAAKYAGIIAFTGGLIGQCIDVKKYSGTFDGTKVFIGTSDTDPFVPLKRSEESMELMRAMGADVTLKVYPGTTHMITQDEINSVKKIYFLQNESFPH